MRAHAELFLNKLSLSSGDVHNAIIQRYSSPLEGPLAQSVEQRTFNPWVVGSIPTGPTRGVTFLSSSVEGRLFFLTKRDFANRL